jgi:hypothetical protein
LYKKYLGGKGLSRELPFLDLRLPRRKNHLLANSHIEGQGPIKQGRSGARTIEWQKPKVSGLGPTMPKP